MAGTRVFGAQRFSRYSLEQTAISCNISSLAQPRDDDTSRVFFHFLIHIALDSSNKCPYNVQRDSDEKHVEDQLEVSGRDVGQIRV